MLAEVEEIIAEEEEKEMPSLNHSVICLRIIRQLIENPNLEPLPDLTLDIDKGITPDISIYPKEQIKPNFSRDITKFSEMPILAIRSNFRQPKHSRFTHQSGCFSRKRCQDGVDD